MRILVDGDGCAGRAIIEDIARQYGLELKLYCDIHHVIKLEYGEVIVCDSDFQSVDNILFNNCIKDDIVVTQDYGVAAMVLAKKAYALSPNGYIFNEGNIDRLLFERHMKSKARRGGIRTKGPKKRNEDDDNNLSLSLKKIIEKGLHL